MKAARIALAIACGSLAVAGADAKRRAAVIGQSDWRKAATDTDRDRLRRWRAAWIDVLAAAGTNGVAAMAAADPSLFDPDRALSGADLPAGGYRCRTTRFGIRMVAAQPAGTTAVPCTVTQHGKIGALQIDGQQRISGQLYDGGDARAVFLGAVGFGDERQVMRYGRDASRDMAGLIERIGERRWRLVLPYPHFGGTLDLVEIVPRD